MHVRISNHVVLLVAVTAIALRPASAANGAEPAKSTIRIVSAAPTSAPEASPQRIVVPSQPSRSVPERRVEQPEAAPIRVVSAAPPVQPAEQHPVRQAIHTFPNAATSNVVTATVTEPNATGPTLVAPNTVAPNASSAPKPTPSGGRVLSARNVYSNPQSQATLSRMPRRMSAQPQPKVPAAPPRGKPFQAIHSEPAVSAYLNMYRRDTDGGSMPNYFAFVLPQLEQQQATRQQAAELQKLRGQMQGLSEAGGAPTSANMSAHARYMDTAQYYGGMKR